MASDTPTECILSCTCTSRRRRWRRLHRAYDGRDTPQCCWMQYNGNWTMAHTNEWRRRRGRREKLAVCFMNTMCTISLASFRLPSRTPFTFFNLAYLVIEQKVFASLFHHVGSCIVKECKNVFCHSRAIATHYAVLWIGDVKKRRKLWNTMRPFAHFCLHARSCQKKIRGKCEYIFI